MKIKQISVFLENKKGRLYEALTAIAKEGVNIRALTIADTSDFGILRMIVNNPELAKKALEEAGFTTKITSVIAVGVKDQPGGLAEVLKILYEGDINVEYLYAFVEKSGEEAIVVLRTDNLDKTVNLLQQAGVKLFSSTDIESL
ncbi:MAG: ACT domain-containing protein [Caldimicrobium sp.]|nr:ACT domain-containing protein [Caldimicrobium sp.]MCX7873663.1 ACT domain-containing protein [Caldimicrobium sp.]MDW8094354.1 ACT domain-containing protein [Caldimicrobium sp.]